MSFDKKYFNGFQFDIKDYLDIPGLYRSHDLCGEILYPFLLPIYFNNKVLIKYFHDSDYSCNLHSETYGNIWYGDEWEISFGINDNGKIIFWLGDILELPKVEQDNFRQYNLKSDNNIKSDFYEAQINCVFSEPNIESLIFLNIEKINNLSNDIFGTSIFNPKYTIDELINKTKKFKRIILNSEEDFKSFISELNIILIESINIKELKKILKGQNIDFKNNEGKDLGSIKILEKFIINILKNTDNIISFIFYLSDIRVYLLHNEGSNTISNYNNALEGLGIASEKQYNIIYNTLIKGLKLFTDNLLRLLMNYKI